MKLLAIFFALFILSIVGVLYYHGAFSSYPVAERTVGPYTFIVKEHVGSYSSVANSMNEVSQIIIDEGLETFRTVGMYYDDPETVPEAELFSKVGVVVEDEQKARFEESAVKLRSRGLEIVEVDERLSMTVDFPLKSLVSYILGPIKVYPIFDKYSQEHGYPTQLQDKDFALEIYNPKEGVIEFIMPIPTTE